MAVIFCIWCVFTLISLRSRRLLASERVGRCSIRREMANEYHHFQHFCFDVSSSAAVVSLLLGYDRHPVVLSSSHGAGNTLHKAHEYYKATLASAFVYIITQQFQPNSNNYLSNKPRRMSSHVFVFIFYSEMHYIHWMRLCKSIFHPHKTSQVKSNGQKVGSGH